MTERQCSKELHQVQGGDTDKTLSLLSGDTEGRNGAELRLEDLIDG